LKAKGWKELTTQGALIAEPGNSDTYETGSWRSRRPKFIPEKCSHCFICWVFCPEGSIRVEDEKMVGIDLRYCKGCGICATECPRDAIEMGEEFVAEKGA